MFSRILQFIALILAFTIGYYVGSGPIYDWSSDVANYIAVLWATERVARGASGAIPLLIAGYLLGQGFFLFIRNVYISIGPARAKQLERQAMWDASLGLASRYGLDNYLERCSDWALEDPTNRSQSLAVFKIQNVTKYNEKVGSFAVTVLLQRIAVELRSASLVVESTKLRRWFVRYFPMLVLGRYEQNLPVRLPSRWSGSTFCLAFRELDVIQVISIVRDISAWIREEIESINKVETPTDRSSSLSLASTIVLGSAGVSGRALTNAVSSSLETATTNGVSVAIATTDVRVSSISTMTGITINHIKFEHDSVSYRKPSDALRKFYRSNSRYNSWRVSIGCIIAAIIVILVTGRNVPSANVFPWPKTMKEIQIVDQDGTKTISLFRRDLSPQKSARWEVIDASIVQSELPESPFRYCQFQVTIKNNLPKTQYVSAYDFVSIDKVGQQKPFDASLMLRMSGGLSGRWLRPGEKWTAWLRTVRGKDEIIGLKFEPDRFTQLEMNSK